MRTRFMKSIVLLPWMWSVRSADAFGADDPPPEAFRVLPPAANEAPTITPYLKYQTEMAWQQDDQRRKEWEEIRTEARSARVQREMEGNLLAMLGGLPRERTPLHPRITGTIPMDGFHIEKLIFESLAWSVCDGAGVCARRTGTITSWILVRPGTRRMEKFTTRRFASDWCSADML